MFSTKKSIFILVLAGLLVFSFGCEEKSRPGSAISKSEPAKARALSLNFADKAPDVYRVTTESSKSVEFEGETAVKGAFRGGMTGNNVEIVFSREVVEVDQQGNAFEKITFNSIKYTAVVKDNPVVDFDSSRENDKFNPLNGLVGKSYTIKMAPNGKMLDIVDANEIRDSVKGGSSTHKTAQALVSDEALAQRHGSVVLPEDGKVESDTTWKQLQFFDFGLMGAQSYEKIYKVDSMENAQVVVSMEAVPSSEMAEEIHRSQNISDFSRIFDSSKIYEGNLVFDCDAGKIKSYSEKLDASWFAVDPAAVRADHDDPPAALKMNVVKSFAIQKID